MWITFEFYRKNNRILREGLVKPPHVWKDHLHNHRYPGTGPRMAATCLKDKCFILYLQIFRSFLGDVRGMGSESIHLNMCFPMCEYSHLSILPNAYQRSNSNRNFPSGYSRDYTSKNKGERREKRPKGSVFLFEGANRWERRFERSRKI